MSGGGGESRGRGAQDVVCQLSGSERLISGQLAMTVHLCRNSAGCVLGLKDAHFQRKLTGLNN